MKDIVILGAGGFAREVAWVLYSKGIRIHGYLSDDKTQHNKQYEFGRCLGTIEDLPDEDYRFIPGIGSPTLRQVLVARALGKKWAPESCIHASSFMPPSTHSAIQKTKGTVICSGVSATVNIEVGDYVNINLNCTLGHDCTIKDFANLSPDVNVSGNAFIGHGADIGTGAVILPGVRIGDGAVVGAGATVIKDVPAYEVWAGTPARKIK